VSFLVLVKMVAVSRTDPQDCVLRLHVKWRRRYCAGGLLGFNRLVLPDHLFDLFAFIDGYLAKRTIFFACSLTLFRGQSGPGCQATRKSSFFIRSQPGVLLREVAKVALRFFGQGIPLWLYGR
jgi:hypothetical protein